MYLANTHQSERTHIRVYEHCGNLCDSMAHKTEFERFVVVVVVHKIDGNTLSGPMTSK